MKLYFRRHDLQTAKATSNVLQNKTIKNATFISIMASNIYDY